MEVLHHGTTSKHLPNILRRGLAGPFEDVEVSLTDDFENATAYATEAVHSAGGRPVVITVRVRRPEKYAEGYLAEFRTRKVLPKNILKVTYVKLMSDAERCATLQHLIDTRGE